MLRKAVFSFAAAALLAGSAVRGQSAARPAAAGMPSVSISVSGPELGVGGRGVALGAPTGREAVRLTLARKLDAKVELGEKIAPLLQLGPGAAEESDEVLATIERSLAIERQGRSAGQIAELGTAAGVRQDDGFLRAAIDVRNLGQKAVVLERIRYAVTLADPCDPAAAAKTAFTGTLLAGDLLTSADEEPGPRGEKTAEIKLRGLGTASRVILLSRLQSDTVLGMIAAKQTPRLEITGYDITAGGRKVDTESLRAAALATSIEVRILDGAGNDTVELVSAPGPGTSLRDALDLLTAGQVETETRQGQAFLTRLGATRSAFSNLVDPRRFTRGELAQGAWFAAVLSPGFAGSLTDPAPAGTRFVVAYLTKQELLDAVKDVRQFQVKVEDPNAPVNVASVKAGDVVALRFSGSRQAPRTTTRNVADSFAVRSNGYPLQDKRFWELIQGRVTTPDDTMEPIPPQASAGAYGLTLLLGEGKGREVDLDELPLSCTEAFHKHPDGSVDVEFVIAPGLLPEGQGTLRLRALSTMETLEVGRSFGAGAGEPRISENLDKLREALLLAAEWRSQEPLQKKSIERRRAFDARVRIVGAAAPRALTLLTEGDRARAGAICGKMTAESCAAAAETLKARCTVLDTPCQQTLRCAGLLATQLGTLEQACAMAGGDEASCKAAQTGLKALLGGCRAPSPP
jgi:hypothetical protein